MSPIKDYESYSVTPDGRVYSHSWKRFRKGLPDKDGYLNVVLYKTAMLEKRKRGVRRPRIYKNMKVHRLVAEAYLPNPDNLPVINHIDGNKQNNDVSNLEWCTQAHNNQHAKDTGLNKNFGDGHYKRRRKYEQGLGREASAH